MASYKIVNLIDTLNTDVEDNIKVVLNSFCSPYSKDIEDFLKTKAIEFAKQGWAQTHLVFAPYKGKNHFAGYFTLANKEFFISEHVFKSCSGRSKINSRLRKKLLKFGTRDNELKGYRITSPLIAQLGKNYNGDSNALLTGDELLKMACDKVRNVQHLVGGRFVYLECEDIQRLIDFYSKNGFVRFGKRLLEMSEKDLLSGKYLVQMLRDLKREN
ncbi:MAG: GNAT family acetyltransferase [Acidaminococcales bacterium]|jgi:hypothetical protein|nr:GNAT family acetyltransferase [Acidaminococcales bacterium]